jgi:subtilisin-like proprotein convertase family protein
MKFYFFLICIVLGFNSFSQVFTGTGGPIPDDGTHGYYPITVSGVVPAMMDTAFGLETVCINLTHTWDDDLVISLIAPDATEFLLSARHGGDGDNYTNTCFNNASPNPVFTGSPPFSMTYKPDGAMALVNNGQDPNGIWTLHIYDVYPFADAGNLLDWSLEFGDDPATPFPFVSANLPLLSIQTDGQLIGSDDKTMALMRLISNAPGEPNFLSDSANEYYGFIGVELKGHSASGMPKKSFAFETRFADSSSVNVSLLGMPGESDWVLHASFADKSLLRNYYTYRLYSKMGHWAPRMRFCEVVIDGEYQGIYLLGERIKRSSQRVNIHSLNAGDTLGTAITGGYIFKVDWEDPGDNGWFSEFPPVNASNDLRYLIVYPKPDKVQPAQLNWIKSYVDDFEAVMASPQFADTLTGYRQYINELSFIDFIIINELTKNVDGYRLSTYFHKDRNGKIAAGPPWDYDLSWGNANYSECDIPTGFDYIVQQNYSNQCPFWWQRFFQDPLFMNKLRCRWEELRLNVLDKQVIYNELDSLASLLNVSTALNFTKWPILGVWVWPNSFPIPTTYAGEIDRLKDWADQRITWLENNWSGSCSLYTNNGSVESPELTLSVYPNPSSGIFTLSVPEDFVHGNMQIVDATGRLVLSTQIIEEQTNIQATLSPGLYLLRYTLGVNTTSVRVLIE